MTQENATTAIVPDAAAALVELAPIAERAQAFAADARSARTREAYQWQWESFAAWCAGHGLEALPANPASVAMFFTAWAESQVMNAKGEPRPATVATMSQALAAISQAHEMAGHDSPRHAAVVREVWKGIKRNVGAGQRQAAPVVLDDLRAMVSALPGSLRGLRDRALLVVGFAGAFRRSELVALNVDDLAFGADGLRITIRRSKTDQEGAGATVGLPYGSDPATCPVRTLRAWLDAAGIDQGAVFRSVSRHDRIGARLHGRDVARIVQGAATAAGLDASKYSGHSLRAGLATTAAKAGKSDRAIMAQGRWSSRTMVDRYVREANILSDDNAAAGIGL